MPVTHTHRDPYLIVAAAEEGRRTWLQRNFLRQVNINPIVRYAEARSDINGEVAVERHPLFKWLPYIFLLLTVTGSGILIFNFYHHYLFSELMAIPTGLLFIIAIAYSINMIRDKGITMIINKTGIDIDDSYFSWQEIQAAFIVERPRGNKRGYITYLVFVMQDNSLEYFDLTGFPLWSNNFKILCTAIHKFHPAV
ncbi:hypothetical protein [Chitinophaga arvensicola]|uniref:Uncharacterized protein n=1 Tax=Chitinophaga arvensicola TaxID=29529 RepID=A0A1I0R896_9BACT|nr:hypothetical protein [Chitinophaga arvensicola]SEW37009.1 hypothetical protein SAMN04488122_2460 [Chitinophaga arvensicola]